MNSLPAGYTHRGDGTYAKRVEFMEGRRDGGVQAIETLVRDATGRLLHVERTRNALAHRKGRR